MDNLSDNNPQRIATNYEHKSHVIGLANSTNGLLSSSYNNFININNSLKDYNLTINSNKNDNVLPNDHLFGEACKFFKGNVDSIKSTNNQL